MMCVEGGMTYPSVPSTRNKWNLHMETVAGPAPRVETANGEMPVKMMCVEGGMTYPSVPSTGIKWKYFNHIGFGESCEEFAIRVDGSTAVSDKQKQYSKISPEAKLCDKLTIEAQKLSKQLKYMTGAPQKSKLDNTFGITARHGCAYLPGRLGVQSCTPNEVTLTT